MVAGGVFEVSFDGAVVHGVVLDGACFHEVGIDGDTA